MRLSGLRGYEISPRLSEVSAHDICINNIICVIVLNNRIFAKFTWELITLQDDYIFFNISDTGYPLEWK